MEITDKQLIDLANTMRKVAEPVGTLHAWWDYISDLESMAEGEYSIISNREELYKVCQEAVAVVGK